MGWRRSRLLVRLTTTARLSFLRRAVTTTDKKQNRQNNRLFRFFAALYLKQQAAWRCCRRKMEGRLVVRVLSGSALKDTQLFGQQDPYVIVSLLPHGPVMRTKHLPNGGVRPVWSEHHGNAMSLPVEKEHAVVRVEVWNANTFVDERIGGASFELYKPTFRSGEPFDAPMDTGGKLQLMIAFVNSLSPRPALPAGRALTIDVHHARLRHTAELEATARGEGGRSTGGGMLSLSEHYLWAAMMPDATRHARTAPAFASSDGSWEPWCDVDSPFGNRLMLKQQPADATLHLELRNAARARRGAGAVATDDDEEQDFTVDLPLLAAAMCVGQRVSFYLSPGSSLQCTINETTAIDELPMSNNKLSLKLHELRRVLLPLSAAAGGGAGAEHQGPASAKVFVRALLTPEDEPRAATGSNQSTAAISSCVPVCDGAACWSAGELHLEVRMGHDAVVLQLWVGEPPASPAPSARELSACAKQLGSVEVELSRRLRQGKSRTYVLARPATRSRRSPSSNAVAELVCTLQWGDDEAAPAAGAVAAVQEGTPRPALALAPVSPAAGPGGRSGDRSPGTPMSAPTLTLGPSSTDESAGHRSTDASNSSVDQAPSPVQKRVPSRSTAEAAEDWRPQQRMGAGMPASSPYVLREILGKGVTSTCFSCTRVDAPDGEMLACKVIDRKKLALHGMSTARLAENLQNELNVLKKLQHPNIITLHEVLEGNKGSRVFLVMELCSGGELFDYIIDRGVLSEKEASDIFRQVAAGIAFCHGQGVVHRDLKPENLLLKAPAEALGGRVVIKISDFGLARFVDDGRRRKSFVGTPGYMAPELRQHESYDKAVDIWALGIVCYVLLAGVQPFSAEICLLEAEDLEKEFDLKFPEEDWGEISTTAKDLIWNSLQLDPDARFTAEQVVKHPWVQGTTARDVQLRTAKRFLESDTRRRQKLSKMQRRQRSLSPELTRSRGRRSSMGGLNARLKGGSDSPRTPRTPGTPHTPGTPRSKDRSGRYSAHCDSPKMRDSLRKRLSTQGSIDAKATTPGGQHGDHLRSVSPTALSATGGSPQMRSVRNISGQRSPGSSGGWVGNASPRPARKSAPASSEASRVANLVINTERVRSARRPSALRPASPNSPLTPLMEMLAPSSYAIAEAIEPFSPRFADMLAPRLAPAPEPEPDKHLVSTEGNRSQYLRLKRCALRYGFVSQRGFDPEAIKRPNLDTLTAHWQPGTGWGADADAWGMTETSGAADDEDGTSDPIVFGVFDGHGEHGRACSHFVRREVPRRFCRLLLEKLEAEADGATAECVMASESSSDGTEASSGEDEAPKPPTQSEASRALAVAVRSAMRTAFTDSSGALHECPGVDDTLSGSAACVGAFVDGGARLVVGNVGNCRCIVVLEEVDRPKAKDTAPKVAAAAGVGRLFGTRAVQHRRASKVLSPSELTGDSSPGPASPGSSAARAIGVQALTKDQTLARKDERTRVARAGGVVMGSEDMEDAWLELVQMLDEGGAGVKGDVDDSADAVGGAVGVDDAAPGGESATRVRTKFSDSKRRHSWHGARLKRKDPSFKAALTPGPSTGRQLALPTPDAAAALSAGAEGNGGRAPAKRVSFRDASSSSSEEDGDDSSEASGLGVALIASDDSDSDDDGEPKRLWAPLRMLQADFEDAQQRLLEGNADSEEAAADAACFPMPFPGTAFSRSLGDAIAKEASLGLIDVPEVEVVDLASPRMQTPIASQVVGHASSLGASAFKKQPDVLMVPRWVIMGSDGLFEFMSNEEIASIAMGRSTAGTADQSCAKPEPLDPAKLCHALVAEAYARWLQVRECCCSLPRAAYIRLALCCSLCRTVLQLTRLRDLPPPPAPPR